MTDQGEGRRVPVEVVIPVRWTRPDPDAVADLSAHLCDLSRQVAGITVVDGSPQPFRAEHESAWGQHARILAPAAVRELWPDRKWIGRNGKVIGAYTGVLAARSELVVIADDDVRHSRSTLECLVTALADAALVRPVTVYSTWPWHARWDGARTLINVALGAEWPGTLAVRRSRVVAAGGWSPDVLFENLELWRTLEARGERVVAKKIVVRRRPPSVSHFWSQRVREAYDDLAQPGRLAAELALLPGLILLGCVRPTGLAAAALAAAALASCGRHRLGAESVPGSVSLWAPVWVLERSLCAWLALCRWATGGVPYGGTRMPLSAHSLHALRRASPTNRPRRLRGRLSWG